MQDSLLTIIAESFAHTFVLPIGQNVTFEAMYWFGRLGMAEVLAYALGALAGCMANWGLGLVLAKLRQQRREFFSDERYARLRTCFCRYGIWLLLLYWIPLGALAVILGGFFRTKWWYVLALTALGTALELYVEFPAALF